MGNSCMSTEKLNVQHPAFTKYDGLDSKFEELSESNTLEECPICHDDTPEFSSSYPLPISETKLIVFPGCRHVMHGVCLLQWFATSRRPSCPLCRKRFSGIKRRAFVDDSWL